MDLELRGKAALITGASRGIGKAIAIRLAKEGCNVAICARSEGPLRDTTKELERLGIHAWSCRCDISQPADIEQFIHLATEELGSLDILICNGGGSFGQGIESATDSDWMATMELNVLHCYRAVRNAIPHMKKKGGAILLLGSISGWKPVAIRAQYGAAKAAVIQLARSLAIELADYRIRVNVISPGSVLFEGGTWEAFRKLKPDQVAKFERENLPWRRLAHPDEIADVAAFLVSRRSSWINGTNICVDGGQGLPSIF